MNILGIDYGKKRIGLAWVQKGLGVVLPYGLIKDQGTKNKEQQIVDLIKKEKIDKLVIGLPIHIETRGETPNTKIVRAFADELKKLMDLPIEFVDETFTTHEAKAMGGVASLDEKAAMLILEEYLESRK